MASLKLILLVVACSIAFGDAVPVGVEEPRPVAPMDQLAALGKMEANPMQGGPEGEKDLAAASSYGYGYYYRPYGYGYGYYPHYYYTYPYSYSYGYYPYYRSYYGGWY